MLVFLFLNLNVFFQVLDSFLIAVGTLSVQTSIMPLKLDLLSPFFILLLNFFLHILLHFRHLVLKYHFLIFNLQNTLLLEILDKFEVIHFDLVHFRISIDFFLFKLYNF